MIVTQKVNLARLTELAIHQSKDSKTGGDLYDTSPMAVTMSCLGKGSYCCTLGTRGQGVLSSAVFYDCTVLRALFTTALGLLKPNRVKGTR